MTIQKTPLALLVALAIPALAAGAEQTLPAISVSAGAEPAGYNAPSAVSATRIEAPLRDIPQSVNVVPQELLRDQGARSLQDALKMVPGVGLSTGDGQRDQVTIRGFSAISDQFVDGLRDDAMYFRDLSNIEQVEVLKGPASVLYGRGSSGGLINRISKKPGGNVSEVSLQLGSWQQRRGEFDLARQQPEQQAGWRLTGAVEDSGSYRDQQFLRREALAPSLLLRPDADTSVLLQAEYLHDLRLTDFGIPSYQGRPVEVDPGTYYGSANAAANDYSEARVRALGVNLKHRINAAWSVRNALRAYRYTLDRNNTLIGSVNEAARTASLTRGNVRRADDGVFNQTELVQQAVLAGISQQLLYGVELGRQNKDSLTRSQANAATVDLFAPRAPTLPFLAGGAPTADNTAILSVASVYAQDLLTITAQWKALAGLRYDRFGQRTEDHRAGQPVLERTDRAWSPRAGLVYQPTLRQAYYASFSRSFQPSGESGALAASNADLAPEISKNHELGATIDLLDGAATLHAALFRLERTNMKSTDPVTNKVIPIGTQRSNGLELSFSGELGQGWQVWSGYAWLDASMVASLARDDNQPVQGKRPTLTARHSGNLWLSKALGGGYGAGAGLNYVGARFANPGNTVTLPAYVTADAMAYYRSGAAELQLNLANLADRRYTVAGHGSNKNLNLPGAPRSVQLTLRYRF